MLLLSILIGVWLKSIYTKEVNALQDQTNMIFLKALEDTEKGLVLRKTVESKKKPEHHDHRISNMPELDSIKTEGFMVVKMSIDSSSSDEMFNLDELLGISHDFGDSLFHVSDTATQIVISIASGSSEIEIGDNGNFTVDIDSARRQLDQLFALGIEKTNLQNIEYRVLNKGLDSSFQATFITDVGKVGNVFLDGGEFLAAVDYPMSTIIKRMTSEILFALLLFIMVGGAFLFIIRSLHKERLLMQQKDDFVSNMTHELKTPISVVNVAIEALSNFNTSDDPQKTKSYLSMSKRELSKLDVLIDKILTINTPNEQKKSNEEVSIDMIINSLLDGHFDYERINYKPHSSDLKVNISKENFQSIVGNILDNALKYGPHGELVYISVSAKNGSAFVSIKDQGGGVPDHFKSQIFLKFFRVPTDNLHDVKGHGLGLYHAQKYVQNAGGSIEVKNEQDGCEFIIKLPLVS